jgi:hypothetical protein
MTNPQLAPERRRIAPLAVVTLIAFLTSTSLLGWTDLLWVTGACAWIVFLRASLKLIQRIVEATASRLEGQRCTCSAPQADQT